MAASSYHHGNLRQALLEQAVELARAGGPDAVVMRDVQRAVGVSNAAAYRHYSDRHALLAAVKEYAMGLLGDQMLAALEQVPNRGPRGPRALSRLRATGQAYVNFARQAPWQEAAISSLTELFAPKIHSDRLRLWPKLYPWVESEGLAYFRSRIPLATRDVEHGLQIAQDWCRTRERQQRALEILQFKLDVLWTMLDAIELAYPDNLPEAKRP